MRSVLLAFLLALLSYAYEVPIVDTGKSLLLSNSQHSYLLVPDYERQICSGMWGSQSTYINGI